MLIDYSKGSARGGEENDNPPRAEAGERKKNKIKMKKDTITRIVIILLFLTAINQMLAQDFLMECANEDELFYEGDDRLPNTLYESKNGVTLSPSGTIRVLVVFAEMQYDVTPSLDPYPNGTESWQVGKFPRWADSLFDNQVLPNPIGSVTKYFKEASLGALDVIGDYMIKQNVSQKVDIFRVKQSDCGALLISQSLNGLANNVNSLMGGNIVTKNGFNSVTYFDNWTTTSRGLPKITPSIDSPHKIDCVVVLWRNLVKNRGTASNPDYQVINNVGQSCSINICGYNCDFALYTGSSKSKPTQIVRHELSHPLIGNNDFHAAGGGNQVDYWIQSTGGWCCLGLSGSSLQCCSGWDRQRMGWFVPNSPYEITAHDSDNISFVNGDLKATNPNDAGIYYLRDFVTTGDAIRIKLPFLDSINEYSEYLWLENHTGSLNNGSEFDNWQYAYKDCVNDFDGGLMSYMQIDKDVRSSTTSSYVYGGYSGYLRPLTANGFVERSFDTICVFNSCVQWDSTYPFTRGLPNPLSGGCDEEFYTVDVDKNEVITYNDSRNNFVEKTSNNNYLFELTQLGNNLHVFTVNGNHKIGMGTNPSTASMMNMVGKDSPIQNAKNVKEVYLNGISIEILERSSNGDLKLRIRFDDVDVENDVRWCSDSIVLNPINSLSGYSLNLKQGNQINLDQGLTATKMTNPMTFNGQKVFASPTTFTVMPQAKIHMEQSTNITLKNGSKLHFRENSACVIENSSSIEVKSGTIFQLDDCALLEINGTSKLIVRSGAELRISPNAILAFKNGNVNIYVESGVTIPNGYVNPSTLIPNTISNKTISTNTTWSGINKTVNGKIIINNGGCLNINSSTLHFLNDSCGIVVKCGGKLIIDGSTLTNYDQCENSLWTGIQVWGDITAPQTATNGVYQQGYVELKNGATIENAVCAINLWKPNDYTKTGGIVVATDANFINNAQAVHATHYIYSNNSVESNYNAHFTRCNFEVNDDYWGTETFYRHVGLNIVKGVEFRGCSFSVDRTASNIATNCLGIGAEDASFTVTSHCNVPNTSPCPNGSLSEGTFTGFHNAIYAIYNYTQRPFNVLDCEFNDNINGIYAINTGFAQILGNTFYVPSTSECTNGIYAEGLSLFLVTYNNFIGTGNGVLDCGVTIKNSPYSNSVKQNTFTNLTYGNKTIGINYTISPQVFEGLTYECNNNINNGLVDFYIENGEELFGGIMPQGDLSQSAGNTFSSTVNYHILNEASSQPNYFYDTIYSGRKPTLTYGVIPTKTNNANDCGMGGGGGSYNKSSLTDYEEAEDSCNRIIAALEAENDPNNIEVLEAELAQVEHQRLSIVGNAVRNILMDSISDINKVRQWLNRANTPSADRAICATYLSQGDYETALNKAVAMIDKYEMEDDALIEQTEYIGILKLQRKVETEGRVMGQLNSDELEQVQHLAENGTGIARSMAKALLQMNGNFFECDCNNEIQTRESGNTRADAVNKPSEKDEYYFIISPVPAKDYIVINYNLPTDHASLTITNSLGVTVKTINIEGRQGKKVVSLSNTAAGVYSCTIQSEGFIKVEKIVVTQ